MPARILDIHVKPTTRSMNRFDIEVEGSHNYFADGVMVHNSPETTTGGRALKFYASVRLDVRRIETLKDGTDAVGNRTRVKVVKNKWRRPSSRPNSTSSIGLGISREGCLIDLGVEQGIVRKSGAWYTYDGDQLGQGKENARNFLRDNPDLANEIEKKIKEKLGVGAAPGCGRHRRRQHRGRRVAERAAERYRAESGPSCHPGPPAGRSAGPRRDDNRSPARAPGGQARHRRGPGTAGGTAARPGDAASIRRRPPAQICLRLLAFRPRTRAQLASALRSRGVRTTWPSPCWTGSPRSA